MATELFYSSDCSYVENFVKESINKCARGSLVIDDKFAEKCRSIMAFANADNMWSIMLLMWYNPKERYEVNANTTYSILHAAVESLEIFEYRSAKELSNVLSSIALFVVHGRFEMHEEFLKSGYWRYVDRYLRHGDSGVRHGALFIGYALVKRSSSTKTVGSDRRWVIESLFHHYPSLVKSDPDNMLSHMAEMARVAPDHTVYRLLDVALHMGLLPHIVSTLRKLASVQPYRMTDCLYVTEQILRKADADQRRELLQGDRHGLVEAVASIPQYTFREDLQREAEIIQKLVQNLCNIAV